MEKRPIAPPTFEGEIQKYTEAYDKVFQQYPLIEDEDLLGQACDRLREMHLPTALSLAKSRTECKSILNLTMERNTELRAKIITKMETFKPQQAI